MRRALIVTGGLLALCVAVLVWMLRTGDLEATLIARAQVVYAPRERPVHVDDVTPGSLGDAVQPVLAQMKASYAAWKALPDKLRDDCVAVRNGEKPLRELPEECVSLVDRDVQAAAVVLKGSHAQSPALPPVFSPIHAEFWQTESETMVPIAHAATIAGLQILRALEAGDSQGALAMCVDGLALGRDLSYPGGYISMLFSRSAVRQVSRPCVDAILSLPAAAPEVAQQIETIRDAWSPFDRIALEEAVFMEAKCAGVSLSKARLERLPTEARALAKEQSLQESSWLLNKAMPIGWRTFDESYAQVEKILRLPAAQQDAALGRLVQEDADSVNPLRDLFGVRSVRSFRLKHVHLMDTLTALLATAHAVGFHQAQEKWPTRAELESFVPGLAGSAVETAEAEGAFTLLLPAEGEEEPFRVVIGVSATPTDPVP